MLLCCFYQQIILLIAINCHVVKSDGCISSSELTICIDESGSISSISTVLNLQLDTNGYSWLGDNNKQSLTTFVNVSSNYNSSTNKIDKINIFKKISVHTLESQTESQKVWLNETFQLFGKDNKVIEWTLQVIPQSSDNNLSSIWRTSIATSLNISNNNKNDMYYWAMHSGKSSYTWENVLNLINNNDTLRTKYGDGYLYEAEISNNREVMVFPLSMFISKKLNHGISLIYNAYDNILAATLDINSTYQSFERYYHKLSNNKNTLVFKTYIRVNHGFSWRNTLNWTMSIFDELFLPSSSKYGYNNKDILNNIGGGMYSCSSYDYINKTLTVDEFGANLNWDASFWFAYNGLQLPPNKTWQSDVGSREQPNCGSFKHGEIASRDSIGSHYTNMLKYNDIITTSYFCLFEFGQNITYIDIQDIEFEYDINNEAEWENSSLYLWNHLNDSIILTSSLNLNYSWQQSILLDPAMPSWYNFLINQTNEHLLSLPNNSFQGISIDRLDHTKLFNYGRDDNIALCLLDDNEYEYVQCASMLISYQKSIKNISKLIHGFNNGFNSFIITNNYQTQRMDLLYGTDIIFSEQGMPYHLRSISENKQNMVSVGLSSMAIPSIMWVYDQQEILNDTNGPHAYFQQRLYMNVNLMAPVYGADHSITLQNITVQTYYKQYNYLFRALRGTKWWLKSQTVEIIENDNNKNVLINSFIKNTNNNIIIAIVLGDWKIQNIDLNIMGASVNECESINPESNGAWTKLNVYNHSIVNVTNLVYGCAVVQCVPS